MEISIRVLFRVVNTILILVQIVYSKAYSQEKSLIFENQKTLKQYEFVVGKSLSFKSKLSDRSVSGRITEITDSTISVENKSSEKTLIPVKDLIGIHTYSGLNIYLTTPYTDYNLEHVKLTLKNGEIISGELSMLRGDSVFIRVSRKIVMRNGYPEIETVKIHRKNAGALGALVFGLAGGGLGAIIGAAGETSSSVRNYGSGTSAGAGAIAGFIIAVPIGVAVKPFNKIQPILGDKEKYSAFKERMEKKLWILKIGDKFSEKK